MFKSILLLLIFLAGLSTQAKISCSALLQRHSSIEIFSIINDRYSHTLYKNSLDEIIENSSAIARRYKLFKLRRMLTHLEQNGSGFDRFELSSFVYKLDRLALADAVESRLSSTEKNVLADARKSLLSEGIIRHFDLERSKTGLLQKMGVYFSVATSWKYWRWSFAWMGMPKLVGSALPPELAHKILLEGLTPHRAEVEKYLPQIRKRYFFNRFSKVYNWALVASLFTVVPYLTHDYYQEQMKIGEANAVQVFAPLLQTTHDMAKVDQMAQREIGALEKYIEAYKVNFGEEPSVEQIEAAQVLIRKKLAQS